MPETPLTKDEAESAAADRMTFYEAVICDNGQKNIKKRERPSDLSLKKISDIPKKASV
jgi:hypothetical protein